MPNEQSVSGILSLCEFSDYLPSVDNVNIESVDTLVYPIDDRIDSSCMVNLSPPSLDTFILNDSTLTFENYVNQITSKSSLIFEDVFSVINEPQVSDNVDRVDHVNKSDSLSISCVKDPITIFVHTSCE